MSGVVLKTRLLHNSIAGESQELFPALDYFVIKSCFLHLITS